MQKVLQRRCPFRAGAEVLPIEAAPDGAVRGIALRTAVQSRPPVPGECRRRHGHRHKRIRRQCAARLPRRSISVPSAVTLTRVFTDTAIVGVKPFSTASLQYSSRDTRDRYLARRHPDAEALWRQSARAKRPARRRTHSRRRLQWRRYLAPDHRCRRAAHQHHAARTAALIGTDPKRPLPLPTGSFLITHCPASAGGALVAVRVSLRQERLSHPRRDLLAPAGQTEQRDCP